MKKALLFLACMGCFISCDNNSNKEQQAPNVKVIRAEQSDTSSERSYSFISQPYRTTELSFRVGGPVYTFDTQSGQFFRKGELIAAIDDRDFLIRKQRAEAIYKQTEADYKRIYMKKEAYQEQVTKKPRLTTKKPKQTIQHPSMN